MEMQERKDNMTVLAPVYLGNNTVYLYTCLCMGHFHKLDVCSLAYKFMILVAKEFQNKRHEH